MKITLILAAAKNDPLRKNDPFMPLSLPLLAGSAPDHEYTFVDMLAGESIDYKKPADVVGISARISAEKTAHKIADNFKELGVTVILGGAQISANPFEAKEHADAVVVGEGEFLWPQLLNDIENNKLKDFYVVSPDKFESKNYSVYQINSYPDLKNLSFPIRSIFKKKYSFDTVFASRGCPINCDFCSVSSLFGRRVRLRNIDDVVKEIDTFKNYYYILDDTVFGRTSDYDYYIELYDKIASLKKTRYWTGQANLDAASSEKGRKVIKKAAKAGLIYAAIGIESINPLVQEKSGTINKIGAKKNDDVIAVMKQNIKFIQDQGIIITGWFTIGYEDDTLDTFYKTYEFCKETNIIPIISPVEALPGTRLYERLKKENRIDLKKKINIVHPSMNDDEMLKAIEDINNHAFSLSETLKRTAFYSKFFGKNYDTRSKNIEDKIHKTIFALILQLKLKNGVYALSNTDFKE